MSKVLLSLLLLVFTNLLTAQVEYYDSEAFVEEALKYIEQEKYNEARYVLAKIHPSDSEYYHNCQLEIANTYVAEEKTDEAVAVLKALYDNNHFESNPSLYVSYGSLLRDAERYSEAETIYKEAEAKYPNYSHLIFNIAISYYQSGDIQKSIDYAKRAIHINPGLSRAHYILGVIALENGQIAEGALAILGFLANAPSDDFALSAIRQLNVKMAQNYLEEKDFTFSESGDDFSQLTLILRNQLALNDKYKLESDIDEIYTRHVQAIAEYASSHTMKNGFFEKQYIPYLAEIFSEGHIENFTYYTLSGLENFQEEIKKKEKGITTFYSDYFVDNFWYHFGIRTQQHLGKESDVIVFCENGEPTIISEYKGKLKHGRTTFVDSYGRMTGEANLVDDLLEGVVTYYDDKGRKIEETHFEKGEKNGSQTLFFDTGLVYSEWNNVNGVAEGQYTTYYKDGSIYCQSYFKNGEYDGKSFCNYVSGQPQFTLNYKLGKLDGEKLNYYQNGKLGSKELYADGELDGIAEYYDGWGRKLSTIEYRDGAVVNDYRIKDEDGTVTYDYVVNGDKAVGTDYINGKVSQVTYTDKQEVVSVDYYMDGEKYLSQKYDGKKLKKCIQYTADNKKGKNVDLKNLRAYDLNGNLISQRKVEKGLLNGKSINYYLNGAVRSELNYIKGKEDGTIRLYDKRGNLENEYEIKEDILVGLSKEYDDGRLSGVNNYKEGKLNGVTMSYHDNGKMNMNGFYKDDIPQGRFEYYNSNGRLTHVDKFEEGDLVVSEYMELDGTVGTMIDYTNHSGPFVKKLNYSPLTYYMNLLNGEFHGRYYGIDSKGDSVYVANFENGKRNGRVKYFSGAGYVTYLGNSINGSQEGLCKYYDDFGVLRITSEFVNGEEIGEEKSYSYDGSIIHEYRNFEDIVHGEYFISNIEGRVLMTLYYVDGIIVKYKTMNDNEWVMLDGKRKEINVNYEDGSVAVKITLVNGYRDEKYALYNDDESQIYERNYKNGMIDGVTKRFYPNGNLYCEKHFTKHSLDGDVIYYDEEGNIKLKYKNVMDEQYGPYELYEGGQLKMVKIYEADELIEIK